MTIGLDGSGRADIVAGGFRELEALRAARAEARRPVKQASTPSERPRESVAKKLGFRDQHDLDKLPGEIARLEAEIGKTEAAMADPGLYVRSPQTFEALSGELDALRRKLEAAEERRVRLRLPAVLLLAAITCALLVWVVVEIPTLTDAGWRLASDVVLVLSVAGIVLLLLALTAAAPVVAAHIGAGLGRGGGPRPPRHLLRTR